MKLLRFLLFPFAILYDAITSLRNLFYDVGIFKSKSFKTSIIAVGNLSVGGTGKTPQIEYLIRLLQDSYNIAVLSRGYGRKTKGFLLVDASKDANEVGDEPKQFSEKFPNIKVAVCEDRVTGIQKLLSSKVQPEVILLDDAYQHRRVSAGFYVLLTKYNDLYADDFLLPTGNLRESKRGAKRADVIIVTKCPETITLEEQIKIEKKLQLKNKQQLFFTSIGYNAEVLGKENISVDDLKKYQVTLVTGIANPKPMLEFLSQNQVQLNHLQFPDHHNFSDNDINKIQDEYTSRKDLKKIILTTEKDFMRLHDKLNNLYYLPIKTEFLAKESEFKNSIFQSIKKVND